MLSGFELYPRWVPLKNHKKITVASFPHHCNLIMPCATQDTALQ